MYNSTVLFYILSIFLRWHAMRKFVRLIFMVECIIISQLHYYKKCFINEGQNIYCVLYCYSLAYGDQHFHTYLMIKLWLNDGLTGYDWYICLKLMQNSDPSIFAFTLHSIHWHRSIFLWSVFTHANLILSMWISHSSSIVNAQS